MAHNPKVVGSNPAPATKLNQGVTRIRSSFFMPKILFQHQLSGANSPSSSSGVHNGFLPASF